MNSKKLIATAIALVLVAGIGGSASAQTATASDLATQIANLQNQLASLQGQLGGNTGSTASGVANATVTACTGITFTKNLTLGSKGADVKCLQALLNTDTNTKVAATGVGSAGFETTTFGGLTKVAVIAFQNKYAAEVLTPVGLTSGTGFVGESTRAKLNAMLTSNSGGVVSGGSYPAGCTSSTGYSSITGLSCASVGTLPAGCTSSTGFSSTTGLSCAGSVNVPAGCTSTTGFSVTTGQSCSGGVSTSGQEGTIVVSANPTPANGTSVYEGDSKDSIYGIKIKATGSDMDVQRVTLKFAARPYSYLSNIYLYNGSTVIASSPLNADTVSKVTASDYEITLSNFTSKVIVPKDGTVVLTVAADVLPAISSDVLVTTYQLTVQVAGSGVRAVDGTGLNQYSTTETESRYAIIKHSQTTSATLTVGVNANTPHAHNVVADTNGLVDKTTLLTFDVKATKDDILIDEINNVKFATANVGSPVSAGAIPDTVYLVDDSGSVIGTGTSVAVTGGTDFRFTDLSYTVAKDTTKTLSVKVDDNVVVDGQHYSVTVDSANFTATGASVPTIGIVAEKSNGSTLTATGSATNSGYETYVYNVGPVFTLTSIGAPATTASAINTATTTTSTITATFNIQVQAVSGDVYIAAQDATYNAFGFTYGIAGADTITAVTSVAYNQPSGVTKLADAVQTSKYWYKISQGSTVTFAVSPSLITTTAHSQLFDLRMKSIAWYVGTGVTSTGALSYATAPVLGVTTTGGVQNGFVSTYMGTDSSWISGAATLQ